MAATEKSADTSIPTVDLIYQFQLLVYKKIYSYMYLLCFEIE